MYSDATYSRRFTASKRLCRLCSDYRDASDMRSALEGLLQCCRSAIIWFVEQHALGSPRDVPQDIRISRSRLEIIAALAKVFEEAYAEQHGLLMGSRWGTGQARKACHVSAVAGEHLHRHSCHICP